MTQRIDVDVRISVELPRRATFAAKVLATEAARKIAEKVAALAPEAIGERSDVIVAVQPPKERRHADPPPAADSRPPADTGPTDHLPGAGAGDADPGHGRDRLDADTQRSAA